MQLAVYACSFWHYVLYWRAYRYGVHSAAAFRRRAVALKSMALLALAAAYLSAPWHPVSAAAVAAGFLLNASGALALGTVRTYYGAELGEVPAGRVTAFPYSVVAHPMLLGNIAAYGGTLLNPEFRRAWWPLACVHLAGNAGLLLMETRLPPGAPRPSRPARKEVR